MTTPGTGAGTAGSGPRTTKESIQDVIISVIIAFALAFVFRGFVVEAFVIPTGSMAPTLMGAHERIRSENSGYSWPVGPWDVGPRGDQDYLPVQGKNRPIVVHDPMTGQRIERRAIPRRSGDRILVLKYLYTLFEPERFDVVVFKFKDVGIPEVNYIKRLVGLPGEEIALVDGDVFFRPHKGNGTPGKNTWEEDGWQVARKPAVIQQTLWQKVFDSSYAPRNPTVDPKVSHTPWRGDGTTWNVGGRVYEYTGAGATELRWDSALLRNTDGPATQGDPSWAIDDRYPYDETPRGYPPKHYPVSDLRMGAGIEPAAAGLVATATIAAREHEFQMEISANEVVLRMRPQSGGAAGPWQEVAREKVTALQPGWVTNVHFAQVDQELQAWVEGKLVASHRYDWSPSERIRFATGKEVSTILAEEKPGEPMAFVEETLYTKPRIKWNFTGGVKLHRVSVDRDLYYQPGMSAAMRVSRGSRPDAPMVLSKDQFFVCGDNSPASLDARLWDAPEPFVRQIDPTEGVVARKLMLGKAFFVYFPALHEDAKLPVPDFGRMRFIW